MYDFHDSTENSFFVNLIIFVKNQLTSKNQKLGVAKS